MFTKHVSQLNYSDIDDLVNKRKEREGYHLDFKGEIRAPDKAKKELSKDISAFANTSGGFLIIGVDKLNNIVGVDRIVQNKEIDEWLNQILSTNIEPPVFYYDPKIISIPDSDKVIVVLQVPESTKKPHIVTEWNNYHIRINDSSKSANHNQIRDMFEFSKNRTSEFNAFLIKRNLLDVESLEFGQNLMSKRIYSEIPNLSGFPKPIILFSLIPKYPNEDKINISVADLKAWLSTNSRGYAPCPSLSLYSVGYDNELKLDGLVLKNSYNKEMSSYFEILNSGFVESGFSSSMVCTYKDYQNSQVVSASLTHIIGYEMALLNFAKKLYNFLKIYDNILLQMSFVNMLNVKLFEFNKKYDNLTHYSRSDIANKHNKNFTLSCDFNPGTLTDEDILSIAKDHSEKICRVFGLEKDYCFVDDELSVQSLYHFNL